MQGYLEDKFRRYSQERAEKNDHEQGEETNGEESMSGSPYGYVHNFDCSTMVVSAHHEYNLY
jgi:hypothetical protein